MGDSVAEVAHICGDDAGRTPACDHAVQHHKQWQKGSTAKQQILQSPGTALGASCGELQEGLVILAVKQLESFVEQYKMMHRGQMQS